MLFSEQEKFDARDGTALDGSHYGKHLVQFNADEDVHNILGKIKTLTLGCAEGENGCKVIESLAKAESSCLQDTKFLLSLGLFVFPIPLELSKGSLLCLKISHLGPPTSSAKRTLLLPWRIKLQCTIDRY